MAVLITLQSVQTMGRKKYKNSIVTTNLENQEEENKSNINSLRWKMPKSYKRELNQAEMSPHKKTKDFNVVEDVSMYTKFLKMNILLTQKTNSDTISFNENKI